MATFSQTALVQDIDNSIVITWLFGSNKNIDVPGVGPVLGAGIGYSAGGYSVVEYRQVDFERPGAYFDQGADNTSRVGSILTITRNWTPWTQGQIDTYLDTLRDEDVSMVDGQEELMRAVVNMIREEFNRVWSEWDALKAAVAAASNFSQFKANIALLDVPWAGAPSQEYRTLAQVRADIRNKFGS